MFNDTIASRFDGIFTDAPKHTPTKGEPDGPLTGNGDVGLTFGLNDGRLNGYIGKNDLWCAKPAQYQGGVKMLAAFTLDADGLEHAAFSARECIGSADIEIGLKTEEYALRIDSYVPYTENLVIIKLACEAGNANVRAGLFVPDFEPARIERASTETTARITKIFDGPDFDFPTHADACLSRTDGGKLFFNIGQGEEVTFAISVCTNHDGNQLKQGGEIQLEALRRSHLAFWKKFWNQSEISIPSEPNIERYWYGSQYIMAC